ncbi:hypothetical protein P280DRAFT_528931 [Massarina eburnea CBS 473.64]|uniref:F-box domain-containing protein n=1 Tax=Massarina eburnea CBS 473.64 TaxID=1395130 RepID=A0A6A6RSX6_9PLEO|nr:hypothetical protein P280DRAFT_528931 [Massarina eburnea CBS 473.64]
MAKRKCTTTVPAKDSNHNIDATTDGQRKRFRSTEETTTGNAEATSPRTSFLDLPGEIRNQIYELALLRPKITIVSRSEKRLEVWGDVDTLSDDLRAHWRTTQVLSRAVERRTSWEIHPTIVRKKELSGLSPGGIKPFLASYELDSRNTKEDPPVVGLFGVNRQIREEAASMFFLQNTFSFKTRWEHFNYTPRAFISDLPLAFKWLRSVHLLLDCKPPGHRDYPADTSKVVELADTIKQLQLRHFGITVHRTPVPLWFDSIATIGPFESTAIEIHGHWQEGRGDLKEDLMQESNFCEFVCSKWLANTSPTPIIRVLRSTLRRAEDLVPSTPHVRYVVMCGFLPGQTSRNLEIDSKRGKTVRDWKDLSDEDLVAALE